MNGMNEDQMIPDGNEESALQHAVTNRINPREKLGKEPASHMCVGLFLCMCAGRCVQQVLTIPCGSVARPCKKKTG